MNPFRIRFFIIQILGRCPRLSKSVLSGQRKIAFHVSLFKNITSATKTPILYVKYRLHDTSSIFFTISFLFILFLFCYFYYFYYFYFRLLFIFINYNLKQKELLEVLRITQNTPTNADYAVCFFFKSLENFIKALFNCSTFDIVYCQSLKGLEFLFDIFILILLY